MLQLFKLLLVDDLQVAVLVVEQHELALDLVDLGRRLKLELLDLLLQELALLVELLLIFSEARLTLLPDALLLLTLLLLVVLPLVSDLLDVLLEGDFELGKFLLGLLLRLSDRLLKLLDLFLVLPC